LAVRESIFAVIFNDVVHFQGPDACIYKIQTKNFYAMQLKGHLRIEDGLVRWGEAHHAISSALLDTLKNERQEMRKLIATLVNRRRRSNATNHRRPHCLDANATCIGEDARLNTSSAVNANLILTHLSAKSPK
jgi:hypothetical protein